MQIKNLILIAAIACCGTAGAASQGESGTRESLIEAKLVAGNHESLFETEMLDRWSVGIDCSWLHRKVVMAGGDKQTLDARVASAYIGLDPLSWLMIYGTAGATQSRWSDEDDYAVAEFKWSAGLRANWWHVDIADPAFMAGQLSFRSNIEFTKFQSDADMDWQEFYADLTANYEVFVNSIRATDRYPYSVVWYLGPAASKLSGSVNGLDFSEETAVGAVAGADLYLAPNLAFGAQVQYFGTTSYSGSLRYHF